MFAYETTITIPINSIYFCSKHMIRIPNPSAVIIPIPRPFIPNQPIILPITNQQFILNQIIPIARLVILQTIRTVNNQFANRWEHHSKENHNFSVDHQLRTKTHNHSDSEWYTDFESPYILNPNPQTCFPIVNPVYSDCFKHRFHDPLGNCELDFKSIPNTVNTKLGITITNMESDCYSNSIHSD